MPSRVSLILPPGWTLHPGGPHIGLPLLQRFLRERQISTQLLDLNIGVAHFYGAHVSESSVEESCREDDPSLMNDIYFGAEDILNSEAKKYSGTWLANEGFNFSTCDLASPESIRHHMSQKSPYTEYYIKEILPQIHSFLPTIIGFNIIVPSQMLSAFQLISLLREQGYRGLIILGGNHISRIASDMKLSWVFDLIDGVSTLQGEETLLSLSLGDQLEHVPNLTWRNPAGAYIENKRRVLEKGLFSRADFSGTPVGQYWGTPYLTVLGSRGCYYGKCTFCAIPFAYGDKKYIGRSPTSEIFQSLVEGIETYGIKNFKFVEEALDPRMLRQLSPMIIERGLEVVLEGYIRFDEVWAQPKLLEMCARAGLKKGLLGLELAPSEKRTVLNKSDRADPVQILQRFKDAGIKTHLFCLFGFPGTGIEEALETVEFVLKYRDLIDTLDIFPFYYARHTQVALVDIIKEPERSWATEYRYKPAHPSVLEPEKIDYLVKELSQVIWNECPRWFHPIYRMFSPWKNPESLCQQMPKAEMFHLFPMALTAS